jgi:uncharacterized membrane protein
MKPVTVALTVLAGAAVIEAALIPGLLLGGAAVLAPKILPKTFGLWGQRGKPKAAVRRAATAATAIATPREIAAPPAAAKFPVKRAIFKTITFRVIATSLDFSSNYLIIGDIAASAALSAYGFVGGPLFFFAHEALWHRFGSAAAVDVKLPLRLRPGEKPSLESHGKIKINRALAKTITFRAMVTTTDFTANFVVTRDLAQAAALTAIGFVFGPFVYYFHEKAWDRLSPQGVQAPQPKPIPPARAAMA